MLVVREFFYFLVNGSILGVVFLILQFIVYKILGDSSDFAYVSSIILSYIPLIFINFFLQRRIIFKKDGIFVKFLLSNIFIVLIISSISPFSRQLISSIFGLHYGDYFGLIATVAFLSIPSFLIVKFWVFEKY
ncbi:hypothetical protein HOL24_08355 [bacterium]|jgi:hypothetical protein|nr:hypothetical protein [bacterium]